MKPIILDTECYPNFWLAAFYDPATGKVLKFRITTSKRDDLSPIRKIMDFYLTVGFNSTNYDLPMIAYALSGASLVELKTASDMLILGGMKPWDFAREKNIEIPRSRKWKPSDRVWDHIDLSEVAPGVMIGLKQYGARMHAKRLQDLPYDPDTTLTSEQMDAVETYCIEGDIKSLTIPLWNALQEPIVLRTKMSDGYGLDLRSKSDAQMAEAILKARVSKVLGYQVKRPTIPEGTVYHYRAPDFISFIRPDLQSVLARIQRMPFALDKAGAPVTPAELDGLRITIGSTEYRLGMGGLHSSEKAVSHYSNDKVVLKDRDVASYYPAIILRCGLFPEHMGKGFLHAYNEVVQQRLHAKKGKNKVVAESLKITINGSFGKLGSKWSVLYAPDLMLQVTITGQLALLMLIELLELAGISVVSANTDGIVFKEPVGSTEADMVIRLWERRTGFTTEETVYRSLHSRDVNSYIAVKEDGSTKGKGEFANPWATEPRDWRAILQKTPDANICLTAVHRFLADGTSIHKTIFECTDIREFLLAQRVNGGAVYAGEYIGKVVRWYVAVGETRCINYMKVSVKQAARGIKSGNKVSDSDGARPLLELPETFPRDVDYDHYIRKAISMLRSMGAI